MIIPNSLKENDTIGIICPSGYMPLAKAKNCINKLKEWGFKVKIGKTLGHQHHYFSGTDQERLNDIQAMIDDQSVQAIMCGRGGYGLSRIIDKINFEPLLQHPKWIIGYSDITLLHCHLNKNYGMASLHAPMAGAFNEAAATPYLMSLPNALLGLKTSIQTPSFSINKPGKCNGVLIGGNLAMLAHSVGSASEPDTKDKILFIEEIGEYLYAADRMLHQLKRAGWLEQIKGLIIGGFTDMKDTTIPYGRTIEEIITDILQPYSIPTAFHFPTGHQPENFALKCGINHTLTITKQKVVLTES